MRFALPSALLVLVLIAGCGRSGHTLSPAGSRSVAGTGARGAQVVARANLPPTVRILSPPALALLSAVVPQRIRVTWAGDDPDGAVPGRLARYKFRLFSAGDGDLALWRISPQSLLQASAPAFAGWDSVPGESLGVTLTGLSPNGDYLFALVDFDEEGEHNPVFSLSTNMLFMRVAAMGSIGPRFTVTGAGSVFSPVAGGVNDALFTTRWSSPASEPVPVNWAALPIAGTDVAGYRWTLDVHDAGGRGPGRPGWGREHWSAWSLTTTSVSVPPPPAISPLSDRRLAIESIDTNGFVSRVIVFVSFPATPTGAARILADGILAIP